MKSEFDDIIFTESERLAIIAILGLPPTAWCWLDRTIINRVTDQLLTDDRHKKKLYDLLSPATIKAIKKKKL